jgi:hypothetical protein
MIKRKSECLDHPYFSTDCEHCEVLVVAACEVVQLLHRKGITLREAMVAANMAMSLLVDAAFAERESESDDSYNSH